MSESWMMTHQIGKELTKFIITTDGYLRIDKVNHHKNLLIGGMLILASHQASVDKIVRK